MEGVARICQPLLSAAGAEVHLPLLEHRSSRMGGSGAHGACVAVGQVSLGGGQATLGRTLGRGRGGAGHVVEEAGVLLELAAHCSQALPAGVGVAGARSLQSLLRHRPSCHGRRPRRQCRVLGRLQSLRCVPKCAGVSHCRCLWRLQRARLRRSSSPPPGGSGVDCAAYGIHEVCLDGRHVLHPPELCALSDELGQDLQLQHAQAVYVSPHLCQRPAVWAEK
mmetsp:Transcript_16801/g.65625  ORF Transcript_16801/g.65625 Transcript_16801/m.65625 type:complete len:222 (-) Transcript_16801:137-802(-)